MNIEKEIAKAQTIMNCVKTLKALNCTKTQARAIFMLASMELTDTLATEQSKLKGNIKAIM